MKIGAVEEQPPKTAAGVSIAKYSRVAAETVKCTAEIIEDSAGIIKDTAEKIKHAAGTGGGVSKTFNRAFASLHVALVVVLLACSAVKAGDPARENPYAVTTFESAGFYWTTDKADGCRIQYRKQGDLVWKEGLELVYDDRDGQYRGSLVGLDPDTRYEVVLKTGMAEESFSFNTRSEIFPVGTITVLPAGETDQTVRITRSGSPDAYHLVTVPDGAKSVLNLKNVYDYGIEIDADFVIVRGVEIRNARVHGIMIRRNRHNIVIEQCHIVFWGRMGGPRTYGNLEGGSDSAIWAETGTRRLTIQRNLLRDPRGASNDWTAGHPDGPQGITFIQTLGEHVIRYNEITSTEGRGFNDGIGGASNFSFVGNMNRDSDIYGNIIRNVWDDAIEVEGANMNVRIWGNYLDKFFIAIATAATSRGPVYIYRNVMGESRIGHRNSRGGVLFKTGERNEFGGGRRYYFHNTALQPGGASHVFSGHVQPNAITRNNIFDVPGRLATDQLKEPLSDYDYDYFSGVHLGSAQQANGIRQSFTPSGTTLFIPSTRLEFYLNATVDAVVWGRHEYRFGDRTINITDPIMQVRNPLRDAGALIPGFNDHYFGEGPDLGAFEFGTPPIEFGRRAYLRYDEGWAPWELH